MAERRVEAVRIILLYLNSHFYVSKIQNNPIKFINIPIEKLNVQKIFCNNSTIDFIRLN